MNQVTLCKHIQSVLDPVAPCVETDEGAQITTHCLYPSFDPVVVFVVRYGEGYEVHDGGGAIRSAWDHGKEISAARKFLVQHSEAHQLIVKDDILTARVNGPDWLLSAILTVANTSAVVARDALESVQRSSESALKELIYSVLIKIVPQRYIAAEYPVRGSSGKMHHFDYAIRPVPDRAIVLDAVSPHHVSVAAKYVAFSDTNDNDSIINKLAVYERQLAHDDASLLVKYAKLVPIKGLGENVLLEAPQWKQ
jgi:hypothetical protein